MNTKLSLCVFIIYNFTILYAYVAIYTGLFSKLVLTNFTFYFKNESFNEAMIFYNSRESSIYNFTYNTEYTVFKVLEYLVECTHMHST